MQFPCLRINSTVGHCAWHKCFHCMYCKHCTGYCNNYNDVLGWAAAVC